MGCWRVNVTESHSYSSFFFIMCLCKWLYITIGRIILRSHFLFIFLLSTFPKKKLGLETANKNFFFQCLKIWVHQSLKKKKTTNNNLKSKGQKSDCKISSWTYHHHHSSSWTQRDYWGPHRPPVPPLRGRSCPGPRNQRTNHSEERR